VVSHTGKILRPASGTGSLFRYWRLPYSARGTAKRFATDFNFDFRVSFTPAEVASHKGFYNYKFQDPDSPEREGVSVFY